MSDELENELEAHGAGYRRRSMKPDTKTLREALPQKRDDGYADHKFIVAAINALPALLDAADELDRVKTERDDAREIVGVGDLHTYQHSGAQHLVKPIPGRPICEWAALELAAKQSECERLTIALSELGERLDEFWNDTERPSLTKMRGDSVKRLTDAQVKARVAMNAKETK